MPSDPLPLSPETEAGRALLDRYTGGSYNDWFGKAIIAIEQEARTLARTEVIAELGGPALTDFVWAHGSDFDVEEWPGMHALRTAVVAAEENDPAALSRLGAEETS